MKADALLQLVRARGDGRAVGLMRIIIGVDCLIRGFEGWATLDAVIGWPVRFPYAFGSLPMPREVVVPTIAAWMASSVLFAAGILTRLAGAVLATVLFYVLFVDQQTYSNHQLLLGIVVVLLACAGADAEFSVARWWRGRGRPVAGWPIFLLKIQLSLVYLFSALAKLNLTYISGVVVFGSLRVGPLALPMALREPGVLASIACVTILVELFLAVAFWSPVWRRSAAVVGVFFHAGLVTLMLPAQTMLLLVFGIVTTTLYLPFFDHEPRPMKIYYDDTCGICSRIIAWMLRRAGDNARFLDVVGTSDPSIASELQALPIERTLVTIDGGKTLVRSQAVSAMLRALPLPFQPLRLMELPGFVVVADLGYRLVADNRHRLSKLLGTEVCAVGNRPGPQRRN